MSIGPDGFSALQALWMIMPIYIFLIKQIFNQENSVDDKMDP
jgi:hypothetical protein